MSPSSCGPTSRRIVNADKAAPTPMSAEYLVMSLTGFSSPLPQTPPCAPRLLLRAGERRPGRSPRGGRAPHPRRLRQRRARRRHLPPPGAAWRRRPRPRARGPAPPARQPALRCCRDLPVSHRARMGPRPRRSRVVPAPAGVRRHPRGDRPHRDRCRALGSPRPPRFRAPHHRGARRVAMRVLVVEDERKMAHLLRRGRREAGFAVDLAERGEDALWMAGAHPYDAIVLDVMLPGIDGLETCRGLRERDVWSPVLMLTARGEIRDRVGGLDSGADDSLVKPFSFTELAARLRALIRRRPGERPVVLEVGDLRLDPAGRRVWRGDTEISLSRTEFALLEVLMRSPDRVLTRFDLLEHVWDDEYENRSNVVDTYVRYLRNKVDRPFGVESIETVRGHGYRIRAAS